jgi:hypothetical protein
MSLYPELEKSINSFPFSEEQRAVILEKAKGVPDHILRQMIDGLQEGRGKLTAAHSMSQTQKERSNKSVESTLDNMNVDH